MSFLRGYTSLKIIRTPCLSTSLCTSPKFITKFHGTFMAMNGNLIINRERNFQKTSSICCGLSPSANANANTAPTEVPQYDLILSLFILRNSSGNAPMYPMPQKAPPSKHKAFTRFICLYNIYKRLIYNNEHMLSVNQ